MSNVYRIIRQIVFPVLAALIWGTAFVSQSMAAGRIGPFTFNALRTLIGAILVGLFMLVVKQAKRKKQQATEANASESKNSAGNLRTLLVGGVLCGTMLAAASFFQQKGIETTTVGKAGFITALYIVIVPIAGLFLGKRLSLSLGVSVFLAAAGLYFLCIGESFTIAAGDIYVIVCAFCFSAQILLIDHFTSKVDGMALSFVQLLTASVESSIFMFIFESPSVAQIVDCIGPLLYIGIMSNGVAYTLQILAQKDSNPTVVSLLLSLESIFSTISGAILLNERLLGREYLGCALMLVAIFLAQLPRGFIRQIFSKITKKPSYATKE